MLRPAIVRILPPVALAGCSLFGGVSTPSDYDDCLDDPARHDHTRHGAVSASDGSLQWDSHPPDPILQVTESQSACMIRVTVRGRDRQYEIGKLTYVNHYVTTLEGDRLAFMARDERFAYRAVIDGVMGPPYDDIWVPPQFSQNGRHVAYIARDGDHHVIVADGRARAVRNRLEYQSLQILEGGKPLAVEVLEDGGRRVLAGNESGPRVDEILTLRVSPRGGRYYYVARRGVDHRVFLDGREIATPGVPANGDVVFSQDERRFAWLAISILALPGADRRPVPTTAVVLDGKVIPLEGATVPLQFVEGGAVLAPLRSDREPARLVLVGARTPPTPPTADEYKLPPENPGERMVLGDSVGPIVEAIDRRSIRVAPDGTVSYKARRGTDVFQIIDNVIAAPRTPQVAGD